MSTNRPSWTITEAATRCGVSKSTIRRYREDGKFPNAWKDSSKPPQWRIPLEDLLANGLKPVDTAEAPSEQALSAPSERERELEALLAVERARREAAERVADMAQASVEDLRMALRMLESAPVRQAEQAPEVSLSQSPEQVPEQAAKRRWWHF